MSAFTRTQSDATWAGGFIPVRATFEDFEAKVRAGINGDHGGTWAPSSVLTFVTGTDPGTGDNTQLVVTGPVKVCYGALLTTLSGGRIVLPGAQFEQLAPGHAGSTRTLVTPFLEAVVTPALAAAPALAVGGMQVGAPRWRIDLSEASISFIGTGSFTDVVSEIQPTHTIVELRVHDGATLASVALTWVAALGTPRARIVRIDSGGTLTPLTLTTSGADAAGWVRLSSPDPARAVQTSTLTADAGTVINRALYAYALDIEEDQRLGDSYPNFLAVKKSARCASTSNYDVTATGMPLFDGVQTVAGDLVLLMGQDDPTENGVYQVRGTGLTLGRYGFIIVSDGSGGLTGAAAAGEYPHGYVVPVLQGSTMARTLWQMIKGDVGIFTQSPQLFTQISAAGNTYVAASVLQTGITDTRWA